MRCAFFQRQAWPVMMPAAAVHSSKTSATAANFVKPVVAQANTSKASAAEFKKPCALPAHVAARGRLVYRKTATAMPSTAAVANSHKTGFTNEKYGVMATAVIIGEDRFFVAITRTQGLDCCKFASVFAQAVCSSCLPRWPGFVDPSPQLRLRCNGPFVIFPDLTAYSVRTTRMESISVHRFNR